MQVTSIPRLNIKKSASSQRVGSCTRAPPSYRSATSRDAQAKLVRTCLKSSLPRPFMVSAAASLYSTSLWPEGTSASSGHSG